MKMTMVREQFGDLLGRLMASDAGQRFIVWQGNLNSRDRKALKILSSFMGLVLVFLLLLYPPLQYSNDARARLQEQQELLTWMRANEAEARAIAQVPTAALEQPLQTLVSGSAATHNINFRRLEPGEDRIRVWIDGVAFNDLIAWLNQLSNQGVVVAELSMERAEAAGRVNVRLGLRG